MSRPQAIAFSWREVEFADADGEIIKTGAMVPSTRYRKVAERQFGAGGEYVLEPVEERSMALHSRYFATLHDLFQNVPEKMQARWPTEKHFRAWLLIECNWFNEDEFELGSDKQAMNLAKLIRTEDAFARISVHGNKVIIRRARSQSRKAMGAVDFKKSQEDVLDLAGQLVGVSRSVAMKNAGKAA